MTLIFANHIKKRQKDPLQYVLQRIFGRAFQSILSIKASKHPCVLLLK